MRSLSPWRLTALLALPWLLAGCSGDVTAGTAPHDLREARTRWAQQGSASYVLTVSPGCFCDVHPVRTTVTRGAVTSRVYADDGTPVPAGRWEQIGTVEALFATLQDAIDRHAASIQATYDTRGIPVRVGIDYQANVADEEFGWQVTSYVPAS